MGKFLALTGSMLLIVALGLGGWWAWPILFPPSATGWLSSLAKADAALVQNRFDLARKALTPVPKALPVEGWLQWEKRVEAVARQTGAWTWASSISAMAQAQFPGNLDLAAYRVWTLLQDHRAAEASALADKVLQGSGPEHARWDSLRLQARIESMGLASGDWSGFRATVAQPSAASATIYHQLASLVPGAEVQKNALLSALAAGRLDDARDFLNVLTPAQRNEPPFDRLQGLMAYDAGDWSRAAALLRSVARAQPDSLMVLADVYLHLGDTAEAQVIYDQLLADHPDQVPVALAVNRATLYLDQNDPAGALGVLGKVTAGNLGADTPKVKLLELEARFQAGETEAVRAALDKLVVTGQESDLGLEAELLKGRLFPGWSSVPRLWSLLHRHPEFSPLAERLAWLLLEAQDYEGADRALKLHEAALQKAGLGEPWWATFLRGLILASEDHLADASDALATVPPSWRDATFYADWSLVAQVRAQQVDPDQRQPWINNALERLNRGLDLLPPASDPQALHRRSLWLTRRGELQTSLLPLSVAGDRGALRSAASEDFRQAVQLDPNNFRASFLLRQSMTVN